MKCNKRLLVCLIFQALLIISEAGRNSNPINTKSPIPGSGHGTRGTSPGRINSGKVRTGADSQPHATLPSNRPQASGPLDWSKLRFPGTGPQVRLQAPKTQHSFRPHTPGTALSVGPSHSGVSVSHAPQTSIPSSPGTSQVGYPQFPTNDNFPSLGAPKVTYAKIQQRELNSHRSSSVLSSSSGYHSGSRSSLSSVDSIAAKPIGLNAPKSTAIMESVAHQSKCVDDTQKWPKTIASAEHCFDYFKFAVAWSPGMAYKHLLTGYKIRADKIRPSWIIHGLWPAMFERLQDPMPKCRRFDISFNKNRFVEHKILGVLDNTWYTTLAKGWSDNTKFWEHEFSKHGSCASRSSVIGDDVNYFKRTLELYQQLNIGMLLSKAGYRIGSTTKLRNIIDIIETKVGATVKINVVVNQHTGENYLTEIYICYDTQLRVMDCPDVHWSNERLETDIRYLEKL